MTEPEIGQSVAGEIAEGIAEGIAGGTDQGTGFQETDLLRARAEARRLGTWPETSASHRPERVVVDSGQKPPHPDAAESPCPPAFR